MVGLEKASKEWISGNAMSSQGDHEYIYIYMQIFSNYFIELYKMTHTKKKYIYIYIKIKSHASCSSVCSSYTVLFNMLNWFWRCQWAESMWLGIQLRQISAQKIKRLWGKHFTSSSHLTKPINIELSKLAKNDLWIFLLKKHTWVQTIGIPIFAHYVHKRANIQQDT